MEIFFEKNKQVFAKDGLFTIKTDQPEEAGGDNQYPEPFKMFLSSLGTCAGVNIKNFCDERGLDASQVKLEQKMKYHPHKKIISEFKLKIHIPDDFPKKYDNALIKSAELCAVKRHLRDDITVKSYVIRE
ncbi:MAG: OsmC family protein [Bacteroidales bacterium]|nr:OsmC family protein [Bacteroidales bacterium]